MIVENFSHLFVQDLGLVRKEISLYRNDAAIWRVEQAIANSAGNLTLHLCGNLNTYIGNGLGGGKYLRQRELEFSTRYVPSTELLEMLDQTASTVQAAFSRTDDGLMSKPFPIKIWAAETDTLSTLVRLATHLNYHLGQINYHRRLLDQDPNPNIS